MKIKVGDIYSQVVKPVYYPGLNIIREVCRARPSGYMFMPKYKSGRWDGYISLMGSYTKFPTGLISKVITALEENNIKCELEYAEHTDIDLQMPDDYLGGITLRD